MRPQPTPELAGRQFRDQDLAGRGRVRRSHLTHPRAQRDVAITAGLEHVEGRRTVQHGEVDRLPEGVGQAVALRLRNLDEPALRDRGLGQSHHRESELILAADTRFLHETSLLERCDQA